MTGDFMNPLDFDQDILNRCAFRISAASSSIADAGDVKQIMSEKLLAFDEDLLPDDCNDPKAWVASWAKARAKNEIRSPRWMNSSKGNFKHISMDDLTSHHDSAEKQEIYLDTHMLKTQPIDLSPDMAHVDADFIRSLVSDEEWDLLHMRFYEGMTFPDIAKRLNITRQGVMYRLRTLIAWIYERLEVLEIQKTQQQGADNG